MFWSVQVYVYIILKRKDINHDIREATVALLWRGIYVKTSPKNLNFTILHWEKTVYKWRSYKICNLKHIQSKVRLFNAYKKKKP